MPTGNFGDIFAGYVAKRMGLPIRWLRIAANINDILPRTLKTGIYEVREVHASASPSMDIQVSSNFERLLFEASGRDAAGVRRLMASLKQSGRFVLPDATLAAIREEFDAGRADETETAAAIRAAWREAGDLVDPHTAVALAVADRDTPDSKIPNIVLSTAHAAKFPDAVEAACGVRPELPAWLEGLMTRPEHITVMKNDQVRSRTIRALGQPRREARSCRMSVECHQASLRPYRHHRHHAASGNRGARGMGRCRRPRRKAERARHLASARAHGLQGHHAALVAGDRRGNRGGRRRSQRRHLDRDHRLLRAGDEGRRAAGARRALRHSRQSVVRAGRAGARKERHRAGDRRRPGHARRRGVRTPQRAVLSRISRSDVRCWGRPTRSRGSIATRCAAICRRITAVPTWWWRPPARSITSASWKRWRSASQASTARPAPKPQAAMFGKGGSRVVHRDLEQAHLTLALEGVPQSDVSLFSPAGLHQHARRRDVVAAVPGGARKARAVLLDLHLPCAL